MKRGRRKRKIGGRLEESKMHRGEKGEEGKKET